MSTTIGEWIRLQGDLDRLDCELLVCEALGFTRAQVIGKPDYPLERNNLNQLNEWAVRLRNKEPLSYLTGLKEFWGLSFNVSPDVLIPRPETELLVELAINLVRERDRGNCIRILDLGTGSGNIAISIATTLSQANSNSTVDIYASDRSAAAISQARGNAESHGVHIHWLESDWFQDIPHLFDLIVSNPPYVAVGDPHLVALRHEPTSALCAGIKGLDSLNIIVREASQYLVCGGWLLVEHGYNQKSAVQNLFAEGGFEQVRTEYDLGGHPRVTLGSLQRIR